MDRDLANLLAEFFDLTSNIEQWTLSSMRHLELITQIEQLLKQEIPIQVIIDSQNNYSQLLDHIGYHL